jgi:hypothetical protein
MSHFLAILKNSKKILKNIKSDLQIDFHMKNILTGRIDHLNFKDEETVHSTQAIRATRSTVAKFKSEAMMFRICISNLKVEMADLNR